MEAQNICMSCCILCSLLFGMLRPDVAQLRGMSSHLWQKKHMLKIFGTAGFWLRNQVTQKFPPKKRKFEVKKTRSCMTDHHSYCIDHHRRRCSFSSWKQMSLGFARGEKFVLQPTVCIQLIFMLFFMLFHASCL